MRPYQSDKQLVGDMLAWLDLQLGKVAVACRREQVDDPAEGLSGTVSEARFDMLLHARLEGPGEASACRDATRWQRLAAAAEEKIGQRLRHTRRRVEKPPLLQFTADLALGHGDLWLLIAVFAGEWDRRYETLFAFLNGQVEAIRPTIGLLTAIFADHAEVGGKLRSRLQASAPLRRYGLVVLAGSQSGSLAADTELQPGPYALQQICEPGTATFSLPAGLAWQPVTSDFADLVLPTGTGPRLLAFAKTQWSEMQNGVQGSSLWLHFAGPSGVGKSTLAAALAQRLGQGLLVVDLETASYDQHPEMLITSLLRLARLGPAVVFLKGLAPNNTPLCNTILNLLQNEPVMVILATKLDPDLQTILLRSRFQLVLLPVPGFDARKRCWDKALSEDVITGKAALIANLASRFRLVPARIFEAVARARKQICWQGGQFLTGESLFAACRGCSASRLPGLARKIEPKYDWSDLVLPDQVCRQLREICHQISHQQRVFGEWGFSAKMSYGKGVTVLFLGPPGTGKTMAAEVIAHRLNLDLYKVDLAAITSKYVGETEKNLEIVFREAQAANAILFFDEADAVFGKRTELKDAHDRYANLGVSYLLQRIEANEGVVLLASNFHNNLDEAFLRRIRQSIEFPVPNKTLRLKLWQKAFPAATPLADDIDFPFLAGQFKLSGANIRNVALAAGFLAAHGKQVSMTHLVRGLAREWQKMGRTLVAKEFGPYSDLLQEGLCLGLALAGAGQP